MWLLWLNLPGRRVIERLIGGGVGIRGIGQHQILAVLGKVGSLIATGEPLHAGIRVCLKDLEGLLLLGEHKQVLFWK